jgi:hypothetical protein
MVLTSVKGTQKLATRSLCKPIPMQSAMNGQSLPQSGTWDALFGQHSLSDGIAVSDDIATLECALAAAPTDSSTGASTSPAITMSGTKRRMVVRFTG